MKKFLSIVLAMVVMLSLVPLAMFSVSAEEETDSQGLVYTLSEDETYYIVSDFNGDTAEIVIPSKYNNLPVKEIGDSAFFLLDKLTSIDLPDSITTIDRWAFAGCDGLTNLEIPDSVTSVGSYAFYSSQNLTDMHFPASVATIGEAVLSQCPSLESITVASANTAYKSVDNCLIELETGTLVAGCKNSKIPSDGSIKNIGKEAFYCCTDLTSITIPNSVTTINSSAFYGCSALKGIHIPAAVTSIAYSSFYFCNNLESITVAPENKVYKSTGNCLIEINTYTLMAGCKNSTIPSDGSVKIISDYAFDDCDGLTSISIPNSVTTIEDYAFYNCDSLTSVKLGNSVEYIGDCAFAFCGVLTGIELPDALTFIGSSAFSYCDKINPNKHGTGEYLGNSNNPYLALIKVPSETTSYSIHDKTKILATDAFSYCTDITNITIPNSVTNICDSVFYDCTNLANVEIPDSVTSIGQYAFQGCSALTSVKIPDSVTNMGYGVFSYCTSLTDVYCEATEEPDEWNMFWIGNQNATVHWGSDMSDDSSDDSSDTSTDSKLGDVDTDGDVDAADYILVKRAVLKTYELTQQQKKVSDIDNDNDVDATDYVLVKRIVLGTYTVK